MCLQELQTKLAAAVWHYVTRIVYHALHYACVQTLSIPFSTSLRVSPLEVVLVLLLGNTSITVLIYDDGNDKQLGVFFQIIPIETHAEETWKSKQGRKKDAEVCEQNGSNEYCSCNMGSSVEQAVGKFREMISNWMNRNGGQPTELGSHFMLNPALFLESE